MHPKYLDKVIAKAGISEADWFRLAQDRRAWKSAVHKAWPKRGMDKARMQQINAWRPGQPLPARSEPTKRLKHAVRQTWQGTGLKIQYHYEEEHSVRNPEKVTVIAKQCQRCKATFARNAQLTHHVCAARQRLKVAISLNTGGWLPVRQGPAMPPPRGWWISTDGSGQKDKAGWGAAIFRWPIESDVPDYMLYGPVITQEWHHLWIGARELTNNTGELSAVAEALRWLEEEAPDDGEVPVLIRFDSYYAANITRGTWLPKFNEELAKMTMDTYKRVRERRHITWEHV